MNGKDGLSRADTKAGRTQRAALARLQEHQREGALPTNIRFVFYELEQRGEATKPSPEDQRPNKRRSHGWPPGEQDVIDAVRHLREHGIVPWDWIVDETRRLSVWAHAPTVAQYLLDRLGEATINPWGEAPPPLILCESRATAGVLEAAVSEYACPIAGTAGQTAGFLRTVVAPYLQRSGTTDVGYLGDLDDAGGDIEGNTRRVLERAIGRELDWQRIAMTEAQTAGIEPIWKVDGRKPIGHYAWEVESMGQAALVALVRDALDAMLPEPLARVQEREREQRAAMGAMLRPYL